MPAIALNAWLGFIQGRGLAEMRPCRMTPCGIVANGGGPDYGRGGLVAASRRTRVAGMSSRKPTEWSDRFVR